ncbi:MAG: peroxiredoxin [Planctomycetota bacterium]|nr:MAG: peroxiredoxin [Planctomycetota bacterium]
MIFFKKKPKLLKVGTPAPPFSLPDHNGNTVSLADFKGQRVLIYFYPKADTPGCTIETKGFCAKKRELDDGLAILGVSFDTPEANKAFAEKFEVNFPLLCDTTRAMGMAYGAATRTDAEYPERITYVLDREGVIEYAEKVTDIEAHIYAAAAHLADDS